MSLENPFRGIVGDQFQLRTYMTKPEVELRKPELLDWRGVCCFQQLTTTRAYHFSTVILSC